jgi:hypothetical protein
VQDTSVSSERPSRVASRLRSNYEPSLEANATVGTASSLQDIGRVYSDDMRGACLGCAEEQMTKGPEALKNLVSTQRLDHRRGRWRNELDERDADEAGMVLDEVEE